jgi:hypothetical protein
MSRTLTFYGASDDLFECVDTARRATEEIGCYGTAATYRLTLTRGDETFGMFVVGVYDPAGWPKELPGCWTVGVCPLGEDVPLPGWPMRITAEGYSTRLSIDVPDDAECVPGGTA